MQGKARTDGTGAKPVRDSGSRPYWWAFLCGSGELSVSERSKCHSGAQWQRWRDRAGPRLGLRASVGRRRSPIDRNRKWFDGLAWFPGTRSDRMNTPWSPSTRQPAAVQLFRFPRGNQDYDRRGLSAPSNRYPLPDRCRNRAARCARWFVSWVPGSRPGRAAKYD